MLIFIFWQDLGFMWTNMGTWWRSLRLIKFELSYTVLYSMLIWSLYGSFTSSLVGLYCVCEIKLNCTWIWFFSEYLSNSHLVNRHLAVALIYFHFLASYIKTLRVRIGNHVEIGANSCIDRGRWASVAFIIFHEILVSADPQNCYYSENEVGEILQWGIIRKLII